LPATINKHLITFAPLRWWPMR